MSMRTMKTAGLLLGLLATTACESYYLPKTATDTMEWSFTIDSESDGGTFDHRRTVAVSDLPTSIVDEHDRANSDRDSFKLEVQSLDLLVTPAAGTDAGTVTARIVSNRGDLSGTETFNVQSGVSERTAISLADGSGLNAVESALIHVIYNERQLRDPVEVGVVGTASGGRFVGTVEVRLNLVVSFDKCTRDVISFPPLTPELRGCS